MPDRCTRGKGRAVAPDAAPDPTPDATLGPTQWRDAGLYAQTGAPVAALRLQGGAARVRAKLTPYRRGDAPLDQRGYAVFETLLASPAYAQAAGGTSAASALTQFMPLVLIFAIMYFLLIRPQQKKLKDHRAMVEAVRRGDQVVTQGGILGKVVKVNDDGIVEIEIADGVKVKVIKSTISQVMSKTEPAATA